MSQTASTRHRRLGALARSVRVIAPLGWRHLALQIGVFGVLAGAYAVTGLYGRREVGTAFANAHAVLDAERVAGVAFEAPLQTWVLRGPGILEEIANQTYFGCQFAVTTVFLFWVYARRTRHFALVRDALIAANVVALAVAIIFPTAPPRMVGGIGISDTLGQNSVNMQSGLVEALNNAYSAMPSLHASYAAVLGVAGVMLARHWWVRLVWALYPVLVFYSIVVTGNHFVLDGVAGVFALAATPLAARASRGLARRRSNTDARRSLTVSPLQRSAR